jgi:hypothetical protein
VIVEFEAVRPGPGFVSGSTSAFTNAKVSGYVYGLFVVEQTKIGDSFILIIRKNREYVPVAIPMIYTKKDYDGYFTELVISWCKKKTTSFKSKAIYVTAGPFRLDTVTCYHDKRGNLHIDFYSAIRSGFGALSKEEISSIIEEWL